LSQASFAEQALCLAAEEALKQVGFGFSVELLES
jgi:hypothetical protein